MGYRKLICLFMLLLLVRMVPAYVGYAASGGTHIQMGDTDPLIYLWGAQSIIEKGDNPFNFFPPVNFLFIAGSLWLFDGNVLAPIIMNSLVGWISILGLYLLARRLFHEKTAILSAAIYGVYPNFIFYGISLYPETLAIFLIIFSFLLLMKYFDHLHPGSLVVSAFLWGLASQTRGGVHLFSWAICLVVIIKTYRMGWRKHVRFAAVFLICTYLTVFAIGFLCKPFQGEQLLNSKSGMGSVLHGANKLINCCTDYGNVRGNLFYSINEYGEPWPEGVCIYSGEVLESGTINILSTLIRFVADNPLLYIKSCFERLSFLWGPNQKFIAFVKNKLYREAPFAADVVCVMAAIIYVVIIISGIWGITTSRDQFKPVLILFVLFYCALIFFSTGNSKLRLPIMPFLIIYASFLMVNIGTSSIKIFNTNTSIIVVLLSAIFLFNATHRFNEILLSPAEVYVRKIELCVELGFPQTALYLYAKNNGKLVTDHKLKKRLREAVEKAESIFNKEN